jgi:hypothetical protein
MKADVPPGVGVGVVVIGEEPPPPQPAAATTQMRRLARQICFMNTSPVCSVPLLLQDPRSIDGLTPADRCIYTGRKRLRRP